MPYLNQWSSSSNITYCEVINSHGQNYAIYLGSDPSLITCEKTSATTGVYNTDNLDLQITDPNVVGVVNSWYDKKTHYEELSIRELVADMIDEVVIKRKFRLGGLPKMTKVLAANLSSIKELMTVYKDKDSFEFLCFGYRQPIAEFLAQESYRAFYLFPERFYTAALFDTRFKNDFTMCVTQDYCECIGIVNKNEDKVSLLMPVEWKTHSEFLARGFTE